MTTSSKTRKAPSKKASGSSKNLSNVSAPETRSPFARAFAKRVRQFARANALWSSGERLLVAVSGGPDSLALLDVMAAIAPKEGLELEVVHVNYRLRGHESAEDEALVRKRSAAYGFPCHVSRPRTAAASEAALRDVRYAFFDALVKKRQAAGVLLAHHEDDQAETLLLRLLRGTGPTGLTGMRPKNGNRVRPFLGTPRAEILRYLAAEQIPFREDASNRDPRFLRNRIRHELLPLLEERYQPAIKARLARTAGLLAEGETGTAPAIIIFREDGGFSLSRQDLCAMAAPAGRKVLRQLVRDLRGTYPTAGQIAEMEKLVRSTKPKRQTMMFSGLKLETIGDRVRLLKWPI